MCDGWEFDDFLLRPRHVCDGPVKPNHTLYNKRKIQGVKIHREYFEQEINLSHPCQWFHNHFGETTAFREFWQVRQAVRYGADAVKIFFLGGPNKIKTLPLPDLDERARLLKARTAP